MKNRRVLLPYEFTLFSNCSLICIEAFDVLLPYEFTLFSNQGLNVYEWDPGFTTL